MMESPWGPLPVNDAHVHFFSHRFFAALATQKDGLSVESIGAALGWQMPPTNPNNWRGPGPPNSIAMGRARCHHRQHPGR